MRPEPNTPPTWLTEAVAEFMRREYGRPGLTAGNIARAVWDALHAHGTLTYHDMAPHDEPVDDRYGLWLPLDASPEPHA